MSLTFAVLPLLLVADDLPDAVVVFLLLVAFLLVAFLLLAFLLLAFLLVAFLLVACPAAAEPVVFFAAGSFLVAEFFAGAAFLVAAVFFAAGSFLVAAVFFAVALVVAAVFLPAVFLVAVFLVAVFSAAVFLVAGAFVVDFLVPAVFVAADFFAGVATFLDAALDVVVRLLVSAFGVTLAEVAALPPDFFVTACFCVRPEVAFAVLRAPVDPDPLAPLRAVAVAVLLAVIVDAPSCPVSLMARSPHRTYVRIQA